MRPTGNAVIACPRCHRWNGVRAVCLYCGVPLPPPSEEGVPESKEGPKASTPGDPTLPPSPEAIVSSQISPSPSDSGVYGRSSGLFAALPPPVTENDLVRGRGTFGKRSAPARLLLVPDRSYLRALPWLRIRLSETLSLDTYTAAMLLQRDVPAFLKEFPSTEEAEPKAQRLLSLGIRTCLLTPEGMLAYGPPVPITSCRLGIHKMIFQTGQGEREVLTGEVARAVLGEIRPPPGGAQTIEAKGFLGRPQRSLSSRSLSDIQGASWIMDLFLKGGPPILRLRADAFDYHCLGPERGVSAWRNLQAVLGLLQATLGGFPEDRAFRKVVQTPEVWQGKDDVETPLPLPEEVAFTEYGIVLDRAARVREPG